MNNFESATRPAAIKTQRIYLRTKESQIFHSMPYSNENSGLSDKSYISRIFPRILIAYSAERDSET